MKACRKCGAKYFGGEVFCSIDGEPLLDRPDGPVPPGGQAQAQGTQDESKSASPPDPFVGQHIEKYKIVRKLGEGGMGVVYEAQHVHIGKRVALKVLRDDFSRKEDVVERFRQEARSASIIGHENIIDITDFGQTPDGRVFFVMEYLEGDDLATVLEKQRTVGYERALRILKQACRGLQAAHDKGIIHRDLKPENLYLVHCGKPNETVKVLDFGIAKMTLLGDEGRKLTKTGMVFGTPEYMSPEQAAGRTVDARIDIYAMGIIMYEMFTGHVPFTGETFMAVLSQHMFSPVPTLQSKNPGISIPQGMEQVILKALAKDPADRFQSMAAILESIEKVEKDPHVRLDIAPASGAGEPRDFAVATPGPVIETVRPDEAVDLVRPRPRGGRAAIFAIPLILVVLALAAVAARWPPVPPRTATHPACRTRM